MRGYSNIKEIDMSRFEKLKLKVVMRAENVSEERAKLIIKERCRETADLEPVKPFASIASDGMDDLLDDALELD